MGSCLCCVLARTKLVEVRARSLIKKCSLVDVVNKDDFGVLSKTSLKWLTVAIFLKGLSWTITDYLILD